MSKAISNSIAMISEGTVPVFVVGTISILVLEFLNWMSITSFGTFEAILVGLGLAILYVVLFPALLIVFFVLGWVGLIVPWFLELELYYMIVSFILGLLNLTFIVNILFLEEAEDGQKGRHMFSQVLYYSIFRRQNKKFEDQMTDPNWIDNLIDNQ